MYRKSLVVLRDEDGHETIFYNGDELLHSEGGDIYWRDVVEKLGYTVDVMYTFEEKDTTVNGK